MTGTVLTPGRDFVVCPTCGKHCCGNPRRQDEPSPRSSPCPERICHLGPGWGTDHKRVGRCRKHLGNTSAHREAGMQRLKEIRLGEALAALDVHYERGEEEAGLLHDIAVYRHVRDFWWAQCRLLDELDVFTERGPVAKFEYAEWKDAAERHARLCKVAIDAGIDLRAEQRKELADREAGEALADVVRRVLADVRLSGAEGALLRQVLAEHMRAAAAEEDGVLEAREVGRGDG